MNNEIYNRYLADPNRSDYFGLALLRDVILPDILGADVANIAYWEGKQLARRFQLGNINDLRLFFAQAAFGDLTLEKQSAKEWRFTLAGEPVLSRIANDASVPFMIESGFLAQTVEQMIGVVAEAEVTSTKRDGVALSVHLDPSDAVLDPTELTPMTLIEPTDTP